MNIVAPAGNFEKLEGAIKTGGRHADIIGKPADRQKYAANHQSRLGSVRQLWHDGKANERNGNEKDRKEITCMR